MTLAQLTGQYIVDLLLLVLFGLGYVAAMFAARAVWRWADRIDFRLPDWRRQPQSRPRPEGVPALVIASALATTGVTAVEFGATATEGMRLLGEAVRGLSLTDLEAARLLGQLDGDDD